MHELQLIIPLVEAAVLISGHPNPFPVPPA